LISVVIPLYNKEEFITKTVRSVLSQTFADFELLIVNDGSTDGSLAAVSTFSDPRIKLITIDNSGVSVARNTGIKNARHDWVAFLDADDWWAPSFLDELVLLINRYPDHKIFATGRSRVFASVTERYEHRYLPKEGETQSINYFKVIRKYLPLVNSSNLIINKELLIDRGMFRPGQYKHEDHDLWLRLCISEPVVFVNKQLSFYLKAQQGTASTNYYLPDDFCTYLKTLLEVKMMITDQEKAWFRIYYNKFILVSYIQNYKHYSTAEDRGVFDLAKQLIDGKSLFLLKFLKALPYKNAYAVLKYFKG
jgi:glycosyltransferase involved in cell wall biosynthesis